MSKQDLFFGIRKKRGAFKLRVVLFCSAMLLAFPATGQSETNGKLAPQDTIELHVSYTLIGRYLEAMLVNNTFTIDSAGALYLPMIGVFPAAGLSEDELAKRINDRLQAMSGLRERAVTFVRRMQIPSSRTSSSAERPRYGPDRLTLIVPGANEPAGAQSSVDASGMPAVATTRERTKADALHRGPPPTPMELEMAERRAATQATQEASAASRARQAAEVLTNEQRELATRERAKGVALEQELLAARREIDALKGSAQTTAAAREEARRALVAARADLAAARAQAAQEASATSRARQAAEVLGNKRSELATRERAKGVVLEQELLAARREIDALKGSAQTTAAAREEARRALVAARADLAAARAQAAQEASAASRARQAAEVLTNEQRELATRERAKGVALEQELLAARRQIDALKGSVQARAGLEAARVQAAHEASAASQARQAAEVLANEQRELATRERAKGIALEQELLATRREIDALKGSAQTTAAEREEARRALVAARADLAAARAQAAQEASATSRARQAAEVLGNEQSELATNERAKGVALEQELLAARRQIDALKGSVQARAGLEAARVQAAQEASAASRARQAAEVLANEQRELATRERAKGVVLEQELLAARREIDALKGSAQTTAAAREEARRALAAVQQELDAARRVARDGSAQARAVADKQERALEGQRQIADELARELAAVQREVVNLKAKAPVAIPAKSADVKAGLAATAALADARRVIDQERQKAGMLERDLAAARQSLTALGATADQAAAAEATAMWDLQAAEAATKRLSEALLLQRQRADEAAGELKTARQERDAAKQEAIQVATAQREALEDEEGKAVSLARELAAARKEIDSLKSRGQRRVARVENAPKASATIRSKPRSGRKSELREVRKTEVRRPSRSVAPPPLPLPARLLPRRPPM